MEVTVIVPTYNEAENIPELTRRIKQAIDGVGILVVDDSPDTKTAQAAWKAGCEVIQRTNKRGLSSAVIDGIKITQADRIIVMDADLQHPPELVPELLKQLDTNDFVVASRYVKGGGCREWDFDRKIISRVANLAARPLTNVKDAVSGFFGFRRSGLPDLNTLNDRGFKIALELLVRGNWDSAAEVPFIFGLRTRGHTKMRFEQVRDYLLQLASLYLYKFRWLRFGMIGAIGALIHFALLYVITDIAGLWYILSAVLSIICASTFNYALNHIWTFPDYALRGNHFVGWGKYQILSGVTDVMYLGLLALTVEVIGLWYMLGALLSVAIVFPIKYKVASTFIWHIQRNPDAADYDWYSFYKGNPIQRRWKRSIAKIIWKWIPSSNSLLDIGCGSSPIISHYPNATGIDTNQSKLDFIKEKCPSIVTKCANAEELPYENESFENVLCIEVLEHLPDPEKAVAEISRVLRRGGRAILATPDYTRVLWSVAEKFTPYESQHITKFNRDSLGEMCFRHSLMPRSHKYIASCDLVELFEKV